ncbi:MAG: F0F1 ATP synthase subunit epsilon [Bacteroidota bacterium]
MNITVLTPDREIFQGSIESVKVPGVTGEFQVLNNHAPIVSALTTGKVTLETAEGGYNFFDVTSGGLEEGTGAGNKLDYYVEGGFIEILNNEVTLLISNLVAAPEE